MKKLELNQMENLEGGISNRNCMLAGAGMVLLAAIGAWGPLIAVGVAASDCY